MNVHALSPGEQRLLALGVLAVAAALAGLLVVQPLAHAFTAQQARIERGHADLARWRIDLGEDVVVAVVRLFLALRVHDVLECPNLHSPVHGLIEVAQWHITPIALDADIEALQAVVH